MTDEEIKRKRDEKHSRILELQQKIKNNLDNDIYQNLYTNGVVHEVPYTYKKEKLSDKWTTRYLYDDENIDIWMENVEPGGSLPKHVHPDKAELITVIQGVVEITFDDAAEVIPAQKSFYIPSNTEHSMKNIGKKELKMVTTYEPPLGVRINLKNLK